MKNKQNFPRGWKEAKMHKVIEHFDNQSKQDEAAEIEAALKIVALAMMAVPTETVPKVRALLVRKRGE